ncbi:hypothetical protein BC828DRAFT_383341 [Blastocladiella britannica]|nr:hypothetical protein BC828DRAFT_383341 [Blastocladiella britannica]
MPRIPSRATLVVCPRLLMAQWVAQARHDFWPHRRDFQLAELKSTTWVALSDAKLVVVAKECLLHSLFAQPLLLNQTNRAVFDAAVIGDRAPVPGEPMRTRPRSRRSSTTSATGSPHTGSAMERIGRRMPWFIPTPVAAQINIVSPADRGNVRLGNNQYNLSQLQIHILPARKMPIISRSRHLLSGQLDSVQCCEM